jgi:hypothetical protein
MTVPEEKLKKLYSLANKFGGSIQFFPSAPDVMTGTIESGLCKSKYKRRFCTAGALL